MLLFRLEHTKCKAQTTYIILKKRGDSLAESPA